MNTEKIEITDKQKWLEQRVNNINSTESSALFGFNKWVTEFELYHQKKDRVIVTLEETQRMRIGSKIEPFIASLAADEKGWNIRPRKYYEQIPELKIASSYDFEILNKDGSVDALLEIKNVDGRIANNEWEIDEDGNIEATPQIEMQAQHQMAVSGLKRLYIAALWGGNDLKIIEREADDEIQKAIFEKTKDFWESIRKGQAPEPDFKRDADFITKLYRVSAPGKVLDAEADVKIAEIARRYKTFATAEAEAKAEKAAAKAELLTLVGEAEKVIGDGFSISAKSVAPTRVEAYDRAGFRDFRVNFRKQKDEK